jgi:HEAT repeat protein
MGKWLRSVLRLGQRITGKPGLHQVARHEFAGGARPATHDQPDQALSPVKREPIVVRGMAWYNTAEARWPSPRQQQPTTATGAEGLAEILLHDTKIENRRSAAEALGQLGSAAGAAILPLLQSLAAEDSAVRQAALKALGAIDPGWWRHQAVQEVMPFWAKALSRGIWQVNGNLNRQIALIGAPAAPGLAQALTDARDVVGNVFVLQALGQMGTAAAQAVPEITCLLDRQYSQVRIAAATALERIGPAAATAIPALKASLTHWSPDVRKAMVHCLACVEASARPVVQAPR